jgi:hypothetical protein
MRLFKFILPALILIGGIAISTTSSYGKAEYTKKEKKACAFCHTQAAPKDGKELTAAGKFYHEKKTLEGFKAEKK